MVVVVCWFVACCIVAAVEMMMGGLAQEGPFLDRNRQGCLWCWSLFRQRPRRSRDWVRGGGLRKQSWLRIMHAQIITTPSFLFSHAIPSSITKYTQAYRLSFLCEERVQ